MCDSNSKQLPSRPEPKLRHEFVGMMFAITIGEVGLQAAALVQVGHWGHFLPAYGHLLLATVVVATSWVGWSVSASPGAREDVHSVFQWEFLVLLLDVCLVIAYFILVRTIDFGKESTRPRTDPASTVAAWVLVIFVLYLLWDCLTKGIIYLRKPEGQWWRNHGSRMLPTAVGLILAWVIWREVQIADVPHRLTADFALLCLVLSFRAAKDFVSARLSKKRTPTKLLERIKWPGLWTLLCLLGMVVGIVWTRYSLPLPRQVVAAIEKEPQQETSRSEPAGPAWQSERPSADRSESGKAQQR